jgi:plasmid maintenance system antidote protein VapI
MVTFKDVHRRLVANLGNRVRSGELSERGLARVTGISQPHVHNVLKGRRAFSMQMADDIMRHLQFDILDLIEPDELLEWRQRR